MKKSHLLDPSDRAQRAGGHSWDGQTQRAPTTSLPYSNSMSLFCIQGGHKLHIFGKTSKKLFHWIVAGREKVFMQISKLVGSSGLYRDNIGAYGLPYRNELH